MTPRKLRIAVLISGGGTNLQAMIDRAADGTLNAEIVAVLSDRPGAFGLQRAERAGIPAFCVDYASVAARAEGEFPADYRVVLEELDRKQNFLRIADSAKRLNRLGKLVLAEQELIRIIDSFHPDYICLAGFMRLVTPCFIGHYNRGKRRILNIHPALLPSFPGMHGYEDTFAYGCKWGGVTVHFVDEGEDTGPIIAQAVYPIWPDDDRDGIRARGLQLEYEIYSQVINWLAADEVAVNESPDGAVRVHVTDPGYPEILRGWVRKAMA
ncbi:MAG: phosphoribosylglycinamide formyltransferase [Desulfobacteraceae bacterium]|nr:phosphoribosylglycinamide formyltransferase [Desulfobacteraceae bacterium]